MRSWESRLPYPTSLELVSMAEGIRKLTTPVCSTSRKGRYIGSPSCSIATDADTEGKSNLIADREPGIPIERKYFFRVQPQQAYSRSRK